MNKYPSIYDPDTKALFIEDFCGHLSDREIIPNIRIFNQIGKTEHFIEKDLNSFNLQDFVFLFEHCGWVSYGTFATRKSFVESYLDWSFQNGKTEYKNLEAIRLMNNKDVTGTLVYTVNHFRDLDELIAANKAVINNEIKLQSIPEKSSLIMQETLTYLIWLRLSIDEIAELKYTDIKDQKIILKDRIVEIPDSIYHTIQECIKIDEFLYYLRNRVIPRKYMASPCVIRSTQIEKMTPTALRQLLVKYSMLSEKLPLSSEFYNKDFRYNTIYRSSLYSDFYEYEYDNNVKLDKLMTHLRVETLALAFPHENITASMIPDYFRWRSFYYGG